MTIRRESGGLETPLGTLSRCVAKMAGGDSRAHNGPVDRASQKAWMMQWRRAAVALDELRRRELRALTDRDALAASDALLSLATALPIDARRLTDSGLVRQQAAFHRRRQ